MKFVAKGLVVVTGGEILQVIEAPNAKKASRIADDWAFENDLRLVSVTAAATTTSEEA